MVQVETEDDDIVLYHQVLHHVQCPRNLRVVLVVDTKHHRKAVRCSTDLPWDALTLSRYDKARFPSEFLCRDAQQFPGLTDWQARSQAPRTFHCNASLSALPRAKRAARQQTGETVSAFSLANLQRRAVNQHLIERIAQHGAEGHSLAKARPAYEALCNYGTITETAACILTKVLL